MVKATGKKSRVEFFGVLRQAGEKASHVVSGARAFYVPPHSFRRWLWMKVQRVDGSWHRPAMALCQHVKRGVRTMPARARGHIWVDARTRTHELIGANRS